MLAVLAHRWDSAAQALVERWAAHDAQLITPRDLSLSGWSYRVGAGQQSKIAAGGRRFHAGDMRAVLNRLPCVLEQDVPQIRPADRTYVAAEMQAFLLAWLTELACPVINRPTVQSLAGPLWRWERWVHTAASMGMAVVPVLRATGMSPARQTSPTASANVASVIIVGQRAIGTMEATLVELSRRLADLAGVELLEVVFDGPEAGARFVSATPWPDHVTVEAADALLASLLGRQSSSL